MYWSYRGELMGIIGLNHLQSYYANLLSSKEIFLQVKELFGTCSKLKCVFPKFKNSVKNSHLERIKDKICG